MYGRNKVSNELVDNIWGRAMHVQTDIHLLRQHSDSIYLSISTNSYCLARSGLDISICLYLCLSSCALSPFFSGQLGRSGLQDTNLCYVVAIYSATQKYYIETGRTSMESFKNTKQIIFTFCTYFCKMNRCIVIIIQCEERDILNINFQELYI